jgi:hypothetical protein
VRCEWCSEPAVWTYPANDAQVTILLPPEGSVGVDSPSNGWYACNLCSELIERGLWRAIMRRAARTYGEKYGTENVSRREMLNITLTLLETFHQARRGERRRL